MSVALLGTGSVVISGASSGSGAVTCPSGSTGMVVVLGWRQNNSQTISSVTYNSVTLSHAVGMPYQPTLVALDAWYLPSPATGANTLAVTASAALDTTAFAYAFSGVNTSGMLDTPVTFFAVSPFTTLTTTVGGVVAGDFVLDCIDIAGTASVVATPDVSETQQLNAAQGSSSVMGSAYKTSPSVGNNAMQWTYTPSATFNSAMIAMRVIAASAGAAPILMGGICL